MHIHSLVRITLSCMIVAAVSFFAYLTVTPRGVPVKVEPVSEYVVILHALPGIPLPDGFKDGDRFDVRKQNFSTRAAIIAVALPVGYAVDAVIDEALTAARAVAHELEPFVPALAARARDEAPAGLQGLPVAQLAALTAGRKSSARTS